MNPTLSPEIKSLFKILKVTSDMKSGIKNGIVLKDRSALGLAYIYGSLSM